MNESAVYNESDLAPFQKRLGELREIVRHDKVSGKHPEAMTKLLDRELNDCGTSAAVYIPHPRAYTHSPTFPRIPRTVHSPHHDSKTLLALHRQHAEGHEGVPERVVRGTRTCPRTLGHSPTAAGCDRC